MTQRKFQPEENQGMTWHRVVARHMEWLSGMTRITEDSVYSPHFMHQSQSNGEEIWLSVPLGIDSPSTWSRVMEFTPDFQEDVSPTF